MPEIDTPDAAAVTPEKRPPVVYSKRLRAELLEKDKLEATIAKLPKDYHDVIRFGAIVAQPCIKDYRHFTFEVRKDIDFQGETVYSVEVFAEKSNIIYSSWHKRNSPPLETPEEKLARLSGFFNLEAFNALPDSSKEPVFRDLADATGFGHLLTTAGQFEAAASGSVAPQQPPVAIDPKAILSLPDYPTARWREHRESNQTPLAFAVKYYGPFFPLGWKRSLLRQPGQDDLLYLDLVNWLRTHENEVPDEHKPIFLPKPKEKNAKRIAELGGQITAQTVPDLRERMRLYRSVYGQTHKSPN